MGFGYRQWELGLLILPMKIGFLILPTGTGLLILSMRIGFWCCQWKLSFDIANEKLSFKYCQWGLSFWINKLPWALIMDLNSIDKVILSWIWIVGFLNLAKHKYSWFFRKKIRFYPALLNNSSFLWESIGSYSVAQFVVERRKVVG